MYNLNYYKIIILMTITTFSQQSSRNIVKVRWNKFIHIVYISGLIQNTTFSL